ncbi:hypothetical protein FACS189426_18950 [Bacteroidia bacterium]|nr:hypothetical protein FACS189426_18950 [Bacteroidia bacterium]GHV70957.1 hypothetical protein FACS189420_4180 [Bacteroidia bacterium]
MKKEKINSRKRISEKVAELKSLEEKELQSICGGGTFMWDVKLARYVYIP